MFGSYNTTRITRIGFEPISPKASPSMLTGYAKCCSYEQKERTTGRQTCGGAGDRSRTRDIRSTKPTLYQLSYTSVHPRLSEVSDPWPLDHHNLPMIGLEPTTSHSVAALPTELHRHKCHHDAS